MSRTLPLHAEFQWFNPAFCTPSSSPPCLQTPAGYRHSEKSRILSLMHKLLAGVLQNASATPLFWLGSTQKTEATLIWARIFYILIQCSLRTASSSNSHFCCQTRIPEQICIFLFCPHDTPLGCNLEIAAPLLLISTFLISAPTTGRGLYPAQREWILYKALLKFFSKH